MGQTVLIIDDSVEISDLLKDHLVSLGFTVHTAYDGKSGVEMARKHHPDVITMDFNMPGANGVQVYRKLRQSPETSVIPIIFLSSTITGIIRRMVTESPLVRFVKKLSNISEIERVIFEMVALPKQAPPPPLPDGLSGQASEEDELLWGKEEKPGK